MVPMRGVVRASAIVIAGLTVIAIVLFSGLMAVAYFSVTESTFECDGEFAAQNPPKQATLFLLLKEYPWWFWWEESEGTLVAEAPKEGVAHDLYLGLDEVSDSAVHIFRDAHRRQFRGIFYKLSKYISLDTSVGTFKGTCVKTDVLL